MGKRNTFHTKDNKKKQESMKSKKEQREEKIKAEKEERAVKLQQMKKKRLEKIKIISKKTKRGQPLMKDRIEFLLKKIQESKKS